MAKSNKNVTATEDDIISMEHYMWQYIKFCAYQILLENNNNNPQKVFNMLNKYSMRSFNCEIDDYELLYHLHVVKQAIKEGFDFCKNTFDHRKCAKPVNLDIWGTNWAITLYEKFSSK